MRLSVLLIVLIVVLAIIFFPVQVSAQHGGGSSGGGGGSHASSGGGFSASSSASVSHSTVSTSSSHTSSSSSKTNANSHVTVSSSHVTINKTPAKSVATWKPTVCRGQNCPCLGGGARNSNGSCAVQPQIASCSFGYVWNGYGCGDEAFFNDCRSISDQLVMQQRTVLRTRRMSEILRYHLLNDQYERCMTAFHYTLPLFGVYD